MKLTDKIRKEIKWIYSYDMYQNILENLNMYDNVMILEPKRNNYMIILNGNKFVISSDGMHIFVGESVNLPFTDGCVSYVEEIYAREVIYSYIENRTELDEYLVEKFMSSFKHEADEEILDLKNNCSLNIFGDKIFFTLWDKQIFNISRYYEIYKNNSDLCERLLTNKLNIICNSISISKELCKSILDIFNQKNLYRLTQLDMLRSEDDSVNNTDVQNINVPEYSEENTNMIIELTNLLGVDGTVGIMTELDDTDNTK